MKKKKRNRKIAALYEKSIEKWKNVLVLVHRGELREAHELAGNYCSFCEDVIRRDKFLRNYEGRVYFERIECERCGINHEICAMGLPKQPRCLVGEIYGAFDEFWYKEISLYDLMGKIRKILVALRREWRKQKDLRDFQEIINGDWETDEIIKIGKCKFLVKLAENYYEVIFDTPARELRIERLRKQRRPILSDGLFALLVLLLALGGIFLILFFLI